MGFNIDLNDTSSSAHLPLILLEQDQIQFYPQLIRKGAFWHFWVKVRDRVSVEVAKTENKDTRIRMEFSGSVAPVEASHRNR